MELGHADCCPHLGMNGPLRASRSSRLLTLGLCLSIAVESNVPRSARAQSKSRPADVSTSCEPKAIVDALRDLFPPASQEQRTRSALVLETCRVPGIEGALTAALPLADDDAAGTAIATTLAKLGTPVANQALKKAVRTSPHPSVRATAMRALATAGVTEDLVAIINDLRAPDGERAAALQALADAQRIPTKTYLDWVRRNAGPRLAIVAKGLDRAKNAPSSGPQPIAKAAAAEPATASNAPENPAVAATPATAAQAVDDEDDRETGSATPATDQAATAVAPATPSNGPVAVRSRRLRQRASLHALDSNDSTRAADADQPDANAVAPIAPPPPPAGPMDGRPLTIGASTVAGAAFFTNLSLLGIQDLRAQVLLGGAGGIIGFGTSWALSRFGVRPSVEQAAWFANTTAWGTLAGLAIYGGSGSTNYKLKYGSLVFGEMVGMAGGVWSAHRWTWTGGQIAMADSLAAGAGLVAFGLRRSQGKEPEITPAVSIGIVPTMVAAAIAGHALDPSRNDLILSTGLALGGGWSGALIGSGATEAGLFDSYGGQGGLALGLGIGYLGGAALGAFSEVAPTRVRTAGLGVLTGNLLGLGTHMMITGLRRDSAGLMPGDSAGWKLGAGLGGLAVGGLAFAAEPYLHPGPSAGAMSLWGATYGAGIYGFALSAAYDGRVLTDANTAVRQGGLLALGITGGVTGLWLSRGANPDAVDQMTTLGMTTIGLTSGWGASLLLTDHPGTKDGVGLALGAALGLSAGAAYTHASRLTPPVFIGATIGAGYGVMAGAFLPSIADPQWQQGRSTNGGALLGLGLGAGAGAAFAQLTHASEMQIASPGFAAVLGLGVGAGAGLLLPADDGDTRASRIGALTGSAAFLASAAIFERRLRLTEPLPEGSSRLLTATTAIGLADGLWLSALVDGANRPTDAQDKHLAGGLLFGGSLGLTSGLVLSHFIQPDADQIALLAAATATGTAMGRGIGYLSSSTPGRGDAIATLAGSLVGTVGGTLAARSATLTRVDLGGAAVGASAGLLWGSLAPTLGRANWESGRSTTGGSWLGLAFGASAGAAVAHVTGANAAEVAVPAFAGILGIGAGSGAALLLSSNDSDSRALRIGVLSGSAAYVAGAAMFERRLHLAELRPEGTTRLALSMATIGVADGLWVSSVVDHVSAPADASGAHAAGGVLLGGSLGLTAGIVLAPYVQPSGNQLLLVGGATAAGTTMGRGIAMLASSTPGTADSVGTLAGSIAGTIGGSIAAAHTDLAASDARPILLGAGAGALWGSLMPTITDLNWSGLGRASTAGLWIGTSSGAALGMAAGRWSNATTSDVGLTALAGVDGLATGLGFGLLLHQAPSDPKTPDTDRHLRVGMLAGSVAGMGLGMASWTRQTLGPGDRDLILSSTVVAGWTGALLPMLGHASSDDFSFARSLGGAMAGAGTASFVGGVLTPHLAVDADLIANAMVLDTLFTGAGLGAGLLSSNRDDAPVWGMLGAGALGLGLGGALHAHIESNEATMPLMTVGSLEGLWLGAMIPYALRNPEDITPRQHLGGLLLGGFGGLGASVLASTVFQPSTEGAALAGVSSALGGFMAGGIALISTQIENQAAARVTLAGSAVGLMTGGLLSKRLDLHADATGYALLGAALGSAEGLTFAWSARSEGTDPFLGSALFGGGLGATLGLATAASMQDSKTQVPVLAGFAAWGGWIGSFSGSLFARDAHEITAGGVLGSNAAFLAGYGLTKSGLVEQGDFGWLSLFAAGGTAVGALAGAPFASRGEPRPILAGLAIGPAVGIAVGTFVAPRLRHLDNGTVALNDAPSSRAGSWFRMPRFSRSRSEAPSTDDSSRESAGTSSDTTPDEPARDGDALPASRPGSSPQIAQDIDRDHRTRRSVGRAIAASIGIEDCTPMIGALPSSPDSPPTGTTPPMLFGLTGRWR